MAQLIIIRGAMGSGKTTLAKKLIQDYINNGYDKTNIVHCEADQFFEDKYGNYNFDHKKLWLAHKICVNKVKKNLINNKIVIVSNTFASLNELEPYINFANENNINYTIYRCTGEYQNVHNVPEDIVIKKRQSMVHIDGEIVV